MHLIATSIRAARCDFQLELELELKCECDFQLERELELELEPELELELKLKREIELELELELKLELGLECPATLCQKQNAHSFALPTTRETGRVGRLRREKPRLANYDNRRFS